MMHSICLGMALLACDESSELEVHRTRLVWEQRTGVWPEAEFRGSDGVRASKREDPEPWDDCERC